MSGKKQKTFLLGVGCPKGGTSWIHDYLSAQPSTDFGFDKEYHVFDRIHLPDCRSDLEFMVKKGKKLLEGKAFMSPNYPNLLTRLNFYRNIDNYYEYFDYLALKNDTTTLVGDVTPSYCALPASVYKEIKEKLQALGFRVRVIFIMRDPVERIWSALRMERQKNVPMRMSEEESEQLRNYCRRCDVEIRSKYDITIANLERVFTSDELHYQLYEDLFSENSIRCITEFLGVPYTQPDFGKRVNQSKKLAELDANNEATIVAHYRNSYAAAGAVVNHEQLEVLWPSYAAYSSLR
jgi:hypothetical protein